MAGRIKNALIRACLRAQGKRELSRLPLDEWAEPSLDGWLNRFWSIAPERWAEAVDLRIEEAELRNASPKGWLTFHPRLEWKGETAQAEPEDKEQLTQKWAAYEDRHRKFWYEKCWNVPEREIEDQTPLPIEEIQAYDAELREIETEIRAESSLPHLPWLPTNLWDAADPIDRLKTLFSEQKLLGEPWDSWIASLPEDAHGEAVVVCRYWQDLLDLRRQLKAALSEREILSGVIGPDARRVTDVRMLMLRSRLERSEWAYRAFAEPFFLRFGRPPLVEPSETEKRKR